MILYYFLNYFRFILCKSFPSLVSLTQRCSFSIYCKAGLGVLNSLNFCLSGKLFISPSNLNESLAGQTILGCRFFSFIPLNISCHFLLASLVSSVGKESACNAGGPGSIPGSGRSPREGIGCSLQYSWASLVAQLVKNLPTVQETWVQSPDWEDPLEKGKATYSSILAWRIP